MYGLEGWSEKEVEDMAKTLLYIDKVTEREEMLRREKAESRASFRTLFARLDAAEKRQMRQEDAVRRGYTEGARQRLAEAFKEFFRPAGYDKAVQEADRSLGLITREQEIGKRKFTL